MPDKNIFNFLKTFSVALFQNLICLFDTAKVRAVNFPVQAKIKPEWLFNNFYTYFELILYFKFAYNPVFSFLFVMLR